MDTFLFKLFVLCISFNSDGVAWLFTIEKFSSNEFISLLENSNLNEEILSISIDITDTNVRLKTIGHLMDNFLMTNPVWILKSEPYEHDDKIRANNLIELVRYNKTWDPHIKRLTAIQYPSKCSNRAIVAMSLRFHAWGSLFYRYWATASLDHRALFVPYIYDPYSERTCYLDEDYCINIRNKYECAFLPTTNCTLPRYILVDTLYENHTSLYYSNFTHPFQTIHKRHLKKLADEEKMKRNNKLKLMKLRPSELYAYGYRGEYNMTKFYRNRVAFKYHDILFIYGFLFRLNYDFRTRIDFVIKNFLEAHPTFPHKDSGNCTTIHIRRGDRVGLKNENIKVLCEKYKMYPNSTCYDPKTKSFTKLCEIWNNLGCHYGVSFGLLSLRHYLIAATKISSTRNIYIMTDDGDWVQSKIRLFKKDFNIFVLSGASYPAIRVNSLDNGVRFLASLEMARRCTGLVGHMKSSVSGMLLRIMCNRHHHYTGKCPPFYDFSYPSWAGPWMPNISRASGSFQKNGNANRLISQTSNIIQTNYFIPNHRQCYQPPQNKTKPLKSNFANIKNHSPPTCHAHNTRPLNPVHNTAQTHWLCHPRCEALLPPTNGKFKSSVHQQPLSSQLTQTRIFCRNGPLPTAFNFPTHKPMYQRG
eukprot:gene7525-15410_t